MHAFAICFAIFVIVTLRMAQGGLDDEERSWQLWKSENADMHIGRNDEDVRREVFHDTYLLVQNHNQKAGSNETTFELGLNKLAVLTMDELQKSRLGFKAQLPVPDPPLPPFQPDAPLNLSYPRSLDWRDSGAVTPVKNQGSCGSCWAFSATGAIESRTFLKTRQLVSLSEQNLMDCTRDLGNAGCNGGVMSQAFVYIQRSGGLNTDAAYPYTAKDSYNCRFDRSTAVSPIISYQNVGRSESALMQALSSGPVAIAIEVVQSFYYYKTGIYSAASCGRNLNHAMLLVGYGTDNLNRPYWLVKNSWGSWWGENGYIRIARGSNTCGIANMASYPNV